MVVDMIHARWRIRRVDRHEMGLMDIEMANALQVAPEEVEAMDAVTLETLTIRRLSAMPARWHPAWSLTFSNRSQTLTTTPCPKCAPART